MDCVTRFLSVKLVSKERSWDVTTVLNDLKLRFVCTKKRENSRFAGSHKVHLLLCKDRAGGESLVRTVVYIIKNLLSPTRVGGKSILLPTGVNSKSILLPTGASGGSMFLPTWAVGKSILFPIAPQSGRSAEPISASCQLGQEQCSSR